MEWASYLLREINTLQERPCLLSRCLMNRKRIRHPEDLFSPTPSHPPETIANLDKVPIEENHEPLVNLEQCGEVLIRPLQSRRRTLQARASVAKRLNLAQAFLQQQSPGHRIMVVDAYRPLSLQRRWHTLAKLVFRSTLSGPATWYVKRRTNMWRRPIR